jgi:hypothetical protein
MPCHLVQVSSGNLAHTRPLLLHTPETEIGDQYPAEVVVARRIHPTGSASWCYVAECGTEYASA